MSKDPAYIEREVLYRVNELNLALLDKREVYLFREINNDSARTTIQSLRLLDQQKPKKKNASPRPIILWINSPGGVVYQSWAIVDCIKSLQSPVCTIATGEVSSAAVGVAMAGTMGLRFVTPYTRFMIHNPWTEMAGRVTELTREFNELETVKEVMLSHYERHSKISKGQWKRLLKDKSFWFGSDKAIELGIVDGIWEG